MITPLISSIAAYMLVTGTIVPWWQMVVWNVVDLHPRRAGRLSR
jgi:hypothetical protein